MPSDPQLQRLLEEILDSGRSPEVVTHDCPELLPQVLAELRHLRAVEAQVDALFPDSDGSPGTLPEAMPTPGALPQIPGYEIVSVLGRGGMGVVYKGRHVKLNRPVAIKMLLSGTYATAAERERFLREAEAAARLQHPNIVQVYDVGDHDGRLYFTMEFLDRGTLAEELAGVPQPPRRAAELLATLSDAVRVAHEGQIIHRDLKPSNILLTADGTPKISDFGLARQLEAAAGLTLTGAPMGTPSYMSPEQARGDSHAFGPHVDIYALGALLYELLTGRPPFRAESSPATLRQVISQEPAPPKRLNTGVPRDLETICLKCLQKDHGDRYASATDLRDDVRRFLSNEPIVARPTSLPGRILRWTRRNPAGAALLAASVLFSTILVAVLVWSAVQKAKQRNVIEGDLRGIAQFQQQGRWADARVALQRAEARVIGDGASDLTQRLTQAHHDLDLVNELDRIRLNRATSAGDLSYYRSKADQRYLTAFEKSGLATERERSGVVAARVEASAVRLALVAALDDWAVCATDKSRREWLLDITRQADPDPLGWGDRIRDPTIWDDRAALSKLAESVPTKDQSASLLLTLGERLRDASVVPTEFLTRVQKEHPADFWANIALGDAVLWAAPVEAAGYYRAALASRPDAAVAYAALGDCLRVQKRYDEARGYYLDALEFDPDYARGQTSLGNLLKDLGQLDEAIACYRKALALDPNYSWAHLDLANALRDAGQFDESLEHYQRVHAVNQSIPYVENTLRSDLVRRGRGEEVRREWKEALELNPPQHTQWFGYAELCLFLGDEAEYRRACGDLLRRFGNTSDPYIAEPVARAVLLAPQSEENLQAALALADQAAAGEPTKVGWVYSYFLFAKGLAEYRRGNFEEAVSIMTGEAAKVLGPCPGLVTAMAKHHLGDEQEALALLAAEMSAFDWRLARVRGHDQWLWHALRREAEALIVPQMAEFFEGTYEPHDNAERLALLGACRFNNRTRAAARLYLEAFEADPTLADDARFSRRATAARVAALAGCGQGEDASELGAEERIQWRSHAKEWLRAELAAWGEALNRDPDGAGENLRRKLTQLQVDPEFAGLREPARLEDLSTAERKDCIALWDEVDALVRRCER
jgi:serine/threonine protein kinase/tetratricopeptide (TPR) repeat protein